MFAAAARVHTKLRVISEQREHTASALSRANSASSASPRFRRKRVVSAGGGNVSAHTPHASTAFALSPNLNVCTLAGKRQRGSDSSIFVYLLCAAAKPRYQLDASLPPSTGVQATCHPTTTHAIPLRVKYAIEVCNEFGAPVCLRMKGGTGVSSDTNNGQALRSIDMDPPTPRELE